MAKTYKITYKTFFNERLKPINFHGKSVHPLYIQVTYNRKTIIFKSYNFELFLNPRFSAKSITKGPTIDDVIAKDIELLGFLVSKTKDDFTLDEFKKHYEFYATDLCTMFEEGFLNNMFVFFVDQKLPLLGKALAVGSKDLVPYDLLQDIKGALNSHMFDSFMGYSLNSSQLYIPVYSFMLQIKKRPMLSLSVMEWENIKVKVRFAEFVQHTFPQFQAGALMAQIDSWIALFRKNMDASN